MTPAVGLSTTTHQLAVFQAPRQKPLTIKGFAKISWFFTSSNFLDNSMLAVWQMARPRWLYPSDHAGYSKRLPPASESSHDAQKPSRKADLCWNFSGRAGIIFSLVHVFCITRSVKLTMLRWNFTERAPHISLPETGEYII